MSKIVVSIDQGHGHTKISTMRDGAILECYKEVDTVVEIDKVSAKDLAGDAIEMDDKYYLVGGIAIEAYNGKSGSDSNLLDVTSYEGFRKAGALITKKVLKKNSSLGYLVLSLSPVWMEKSADYKKYISEKVGFKSSAISVIPQGAGAKIAIDHVAMTPNSGSSGVVIPNYLLFDIGFNTIDVVSVISGKSLSSDRIGYENEGVIKVLKKLLVFLKEKHSLSVSHEEGREILLKGVYKSSGNTIELETVIERFIDEYMKDVVKFIFEHYKTKVKRVSNLVFVGGGAEMIRKSLPKFKEYYQRELGTSIGETFIMIPEDRCEYYNSIGGLYFGSERLKDLKKA